MPEVNQREIIFNILHAVLEDHAQLHLVLAQTLSQHQALDKQQRAFITQVVKGSVAHLVQVDCILAQFVTKPKPEKLKPAIRTILRSSIYQLYFLEGVPDSAVCNEAVKLAKKKGYSGLAGFVNGVLRNVARNKSSIQWTTLGQRYSIPQWLEELWTTQYGENPGEVEAVMRGLLQETSLYVRVNTARVAPEELAQRLRAQGIVVQAAEDLRQSSDLLVPDYVLAISGMDHLGAIPEFVEGLFYVQDLSSMQVAQAAGIKEGDFVLDVCAAPGGKSLHAAQLLAGGGQVEARDLTERKLALIEENIARSGVSNIRTKQWDATVLDETMVHQADVVLCDAPCSGLGIIRKKPDIKLHMSRQQQEELVALQRRILDTVCQYVKPGGVLMYSTCTICRDENDYNLAYFLSQHPEFSLEVQRQIMPYEGCDGFFYGRLRRKA